MSPASSALAGRFITTEPTGKTFLSTALPQKKQKQKKTKNKTYEGKLSPSFWM